MCTVDRSLNLRSYQTLFFSCHWQLFKQEMSAFMVLCSHLLTRIVTNSRPWLPVTLYSDCQEADLCDFNVCVHVSQFHPHSLVELLLRVGYESLVGKNVKTMVFKKWPVCVSDGVRLQSCCMWLEASRIWWVLYSEAPKVKSLLSFPKLWHNYNKV